MSANRYRSSLAAIDTVDTIRRWAPRPIRPTLDPLLDDIIAFVILGLTHPDEPNDPQSVIDSAIRSLDYLANELDRHNLPEAAERLRRCRDELAHTVPPRTKH